ncbi:MAG: hypothetical protein HN668_12335 [Nitrospina sp.]|nr:hypothetical protein [Nitrospina sp.]
MRPLFARPGTTLIFTFLFSVSSLAISILIANPIYTSVASAQTVNTGDIFNKAITTQKLDGQAVTTGKLAGQAVTTGKLASQAVTSGKLAADSVGTGKIKADAVTSAKIKDGTIKLQDLNSTIPTQITTAQTTADTANTAATAAQTTADTANTAAGAAQATADTASTNATAAQTTATNAETTANAAQTTADGLQTQVTSAVNTANSAQTTATSAQTTANSLSSQVSTHISGSESRLTALESAQEILVDDRADGTYILSAETLPLDGGVNFGIRIRGDGLINLAGTITEIELGGIPGTQIFGSPFTSQLLEYQWPRGSFKPGASYLLKVFDRGLTQIGASNISEFEYHFEGQSKINKIQITNGGDGNDIEDLLTSCTTTSTGELQCENVNIERKITAIEMEDTGFTTSCSTTSTGTLVCEESFGGPVGPKGTDGTNGTNGTNGIDGVDGTNGTDGTDGTNGTNGSSSQDDWADGVYITKVFTGDLNSTCLDDEIRIEGVNLGTIGDIGHIVFIGSTPIATGGTSGTGFLCVTPDAGIDTLTGSFNVRIITPTGDTTSFDFKGAPSLVKSNIYENSTTTTNNLGFDVVSNVSCDDANDVLLHTGYTLTANSAANRPDVTHSRTTQTSSDVNLATYNFRGVCGTSGSGICTVTTYATCLRVP